MHKFKLKRGSWIKCAWFNHVSLSLKELSSCLKLNIQIPLSLLSDGEKLWYFKLRQFHLIEFRVWKGKGLWPRISKIQGLEYQSLFQGLSFFVPDSVSKRIKYKICFKFRDGSLVRFKHVLKFLRGSFHSFMGLTVMCKNCILKNIYRKLDHQCINNTPDNGDEVESIPWLSKVTLEIKQYYSKIYELCIITIKGL